MTNYLFVFIRLILCYKTYIYLLFVHIWWWAARWFVSWFSEFLVKPCRAYLNDTMMARVHQDVFIFILVCCRLYRTSISFAFGQRCARPLRPASRRWYRSLAIAKKKKNERSPLAVCWNTHRKKFVWHAFGFDYIIVGVVRWSERERRENKSRSKKTKVAEERKKTQPE